MDSHRHQNAWIISVNMGYGHARAAYGLEDLARGGIITANDYPGIPSRDRELWRKSRDAYEFISRLQPLPGIGKIAFGVLDYLQSIPDFYPRRDLSQPTLQLKYVYHLIRRKNLGKHLIEKLAKKPLPLVSTFFNVGFAAEEHGYPGDIYLVTTDADVSRAWVPLDPKRSRIKYFASNGRVVERLKLYGVRVENIFLTGFPLPKKLIGGPEATIVKRDLAARICNLDPNGIFIKKYEKVLLDELGPELCEFKKKHPLTLTFAVGGAGAQRELGIEIIKGLRYRIMQGAIQVNLEAGIRPEVAAYFEREVRKLRLGKALGKGIHIHAYPDRGKYFRALNDTLRKTDILWTKPSEMSFYCGIGLPIIMAPTIGSQEDFNKLWLESAVNAGTSQLDPAYCGEWLFDWINSGGLAKYAWNGYIEAPTHGTYRIESVLTGEKMPVAELPLIV
ncbi:hypothetical protein EDM68_02130 [Candidatus Uhrbacteria bacterium]|nr:MAG: hypothetical protein EDM68_02130 [Candidatus Uhrbacteria bacterium]